jgi:hypothetical protein
MVADIPWTIGCCSIRRATDNCTSLWVQRVGRPLSHGGLERLEPDIGKLIRPVLRGGGGGNVVSLLDAMRLTVMQQTAKGLPHTIQDQEETYTLRDPVIHSLERLKWSLWHGNVYKAFQKITDLAMDLDVAVATTDDAMARKLLRAVEEFYTYIERNRAFIPNYGERYCYGERISTGFVESTVNQVISKRFCKKQQMQWTKRGAHLLLQMRVKTLNHELGTIFQRWYPDLQLEEESLAA